jgi:hypothetical protein
MEDIGGIIQAISSGAGTLVAYFVNFSSEFEVIGNTIIYIFAPAIGILISAWGVMDFIKLKNRGQGGGGGSSPVSIIVRFIVGPLTIQIAAFINAVSESVFGEREFEQAENMAATYANAAQNADGDPVRGGLAALVGFLVIVGWISALRAMVAFARIGSPSENGYELFRTGASRLVAATFLCMFQFVVDDLIESVGGGKGAFSSALGL